MARIKGDRYYTPGWAVNQGIRLVLPKLGIARAPKSILEPCAGMGAYVNRLRLAFPEAHITANDVWKPRDMERWKYADKSLFSNYLHWKVKNPRCPEFALGMTNPPFSLALEFAALMLQMCWTVVLLTRTNFLSTAGRYHFLRKHRPTRVAFLTTRPSFINGHNDTWDYCYVCWQQFPLDFTDSVGQPVPPPKYTKLQWLPPATKAEKQEEGGTKRWLFKAVSPKEE